MKNQDSEAASISIQLTDLGPFATSSNNVLLSRTQTLAWRTRIMSTEGFSLLLSLPCYIVKLTLQITVKLNTDIFSLP